MPPPSTRRQFLGTAGSVLAMGTASALAAGKLEPVRTAVIGTGARGSDLIRSLSTIEGVDLVGVCDDYAPHREKGAAYAGPQAKAFDDYRRMLDELKPQAVVVAVPLDTHYRVASDALAAGCDVFCEKTMCYSVDEARRLAEQVAQTKRVFQVGLQRRANPIYQQAAGMVQAGLLGQVTAIKAQWHRNNSWRRPVPVPRDDGRWTQLERRLNWRLYRDRSRGLLTELGSHQLDVANWLLGTTPRRVLATGGIDYWRDGREVWDNVFCVYEYQLTPPSSGGSPSGAEPYTVRVTYSSICNNAYEGASELVMGTRGSLYLTSNKGLFYREASADDVGWVRRANKTDAQGDPNASIITSGKTLKLSNSPWAHRGEPIEIDFLEGDDTRDELVSFIDHVRRGDVHTICDAQEGLRDTCTVMMAHQAIEQGTAVDYPA